MAQIKNNRSGPQRLEKLGITAIQERLEVSPIIADPGTLTPDEGEGGDGKTYVCNVFPPENPKLTAQEFVPWDQ
jgi:hypothetical protein